MSHPIVSLPSLGRHLRPCVPPISCFDFELRKSGKDGEMRRRSSGGAGSGSGLEEMTTGEFHNRFVLR